MTLGKRWVSGRRHLGEIWGCAVSGRGKGKRQGPEMGRSPLRNGKREARGAGGCGARSQESKMILEDKVMARL